jgi:hypothetical protein
MFCLARPLAASKQWRQRTCLRDGHRQAFDLGFHAGQFRSRAGERRAEALRETLTNLTVAGTCSVGLEGPPRLPPRPSGGAAIVDDSARPPSVAASAEGARRANSLHSTMWM